MNLQRMPSRPDNPERSTRVRLSTFYFTLMTTSAVATPYLGLWLSGQGLSEQEVGIANALPLLCIMVLNLVTGRMADLAGDWRKSIRTGIAVGCITPFILLFVDSPYAIIIGWTLAVLPTNLVIPITDAASVAATGRSGEAFPRIRMWGTIGYMVATFVSGVIVARYGIFAFPWIIAGLALLRLSAGAFLPPLRPNSHVSQFDVASKGHTAITKQLTNMMRPWFITAILGGALINASHMLQNSFGAIFWNAAGLGAGEIAMLWMTASIAEIVMMFCFSSLAHRFPARVLLLISAIVSIIRWIGLAMSPPVAGLIVLQILHFATFGLSYLAVVAFIANSVQKNAAASAQSFLSVFRQVTSVLALLAFGHMVGRWGEATYYLAAGLSVIGAICVVISLMLTPGSSVDKLGVEG